MTARDDDNRHADRLLGSVEPTDAGVSSVLAATGEFAGGLSLDATQKSHLMIVVEEVILNIVNHAEAPPDSRIDYLIEEFTAGIAIKVSDAGKPFDPRSLINRDVVEPSLDREEGGWGWQMVFAWCDVLSYVHEDGRNHLHLLLKNR